MAITVNGFSGQVRTAEPQTIGNLTLYPLFAAQGPDPQAAELQAPFYLLLEEALGSKTFEIGEISESGSVNTVIITNMTGQPVLILDGEEIVGAKQNRMVNATILVASGRETAIPVSCVERGRWHYNTDKFAKSDTIGYSTLRRQKSEQVNFSLHQHKSFAADQGAIWAEIDRTTVNLDTNAPTGALRDTYSSREDELNEMVKDLHYQPGQIGVAVYIKNRFACLDLFDNSATLAKLWSRLLKSYAVEALNTRGRAAAKPTPPAAAIIEAIDKSEYMTYTSVSLGRDLRVTGPGIVGAGLLIDDELIHLSIFPREESAAQVGDINSPHRRRRNIY
jgi:hypothetical protein